MISPRNKNEASGPLDPAMGTTWNDRYEPLELIAATDWAEVYKARDGLLNRLVAIKLLLPILSDDSECVRRFQAQSMAAIELQHPSIAAIYDFQLSPQGRPFLVTELLEGNKLSSRLAEEPTLTAGQVVEIFLKVADALALAHDQGITGNELSTDKIILLNGPGDQISPKLVDVGINPRRDVGTTAPATAPAVGETTQTDPTQGKNMGLLADVWTLGALMYETLTGSRIAQAAPQSKPPSLAEAAPQRSYSERLERVIFKALELKAADRFQTMDELRTALRAVMKPEDTAARAAVSEAQKHSATANPARFPVWQSLLFAGALVVLLIVASFSRMNSSRFPGQIASQRKDQIVVSLPMPPLIRMDTAPSPASSKDISDADALLTRALSSLGAQDYDEAVRLSRRALAVLSRSPISLEEGVAHLTIGIALQRTGTQKNAEVEVRQAVYLLAQFPETEQAYHESACILLGIILSNSQRGDEAIESWKKCLTIHSYHSELALRYRADALFYMGSDYRARGDLQQMESAFGELRKLAADNRKMLAADSLVAGKVAYSYCIASKGYYDHGKFKLAEQSARVALPLLRKSARNNYEYTMFLGGDLQLVIRALAAQGKVDNTAALQAELDAVKQKLKAGGGTYELK